MNDDEHPSSYRTMNVPNWLTNGKADKLIDRLLTTMNESEKSSMSTSLHYRRIFKLLILTDASLTSCLVKRFSLKLLHRTAIVLQYWNKTILNKQFIVRTSYITSNL